MHQTLTIYRAPAELCALAQVRAALERLQVPVAALGLLDSEQEELRVDTDAGPVTCAFWSPETYLTVPVHFPGDLQDLRVALRAEQVAYRLEHEAGQAAPVLYWQPGWPHEQVRFEHPELDGTLDSRFFAAHAYLSDAELGARVREHFTFAFTPTAA